MLTFERLVEGFRELGVEEGDTLLVHSSYKSFGEIKGGPQTVIRALEAVLGAPDLSTSPVGGVSATTFGNVFGMAALGDNLFVSDSDGNRIRRFAFRY